MEKKESRWENNNNNQKREGNSQQPKFQASRISSDSKVISV
jgi:hypothetical protein